MIRTVLIFDVASGGEDGVVDLYEREAILEYSLEHSDALASELSVSTDGSGTILVTALWPDVAAYQGWLDNPWRARSGEWLEELGARPGIGATFAIRRSVVKNPATGAVEASCTERLLP